MRYNGLNHSLHHAFLLWAVWVILLWPKKYIYRASVSMVEKPIGLSKLKK